MAKVQSHNLSPKELAAVQREFQRTLSHLERSGDLFLLLTHALTESERIMLARRLQIARLLVRGIPIHGIAERLHVGVATVQMVDRWLKSWRGYRKELPKALRSMEEKRWKTLDDMPHSFRSLRRRYPLHFLLFNLVLEER